MPPEIMVHINHRSRPMRDGGGKPSMGRLSPAFRPPAALVDIGHTILDTCNTNINHNTQLAASADNMLYNTDGNSPLPQQHVTEIRELLQSNFDCYKEPTEGQPFYLDLLCSMAQTLHSHDTNSFVDET